jgi:hypothetical protein
MIPEQTTLRKNLKTVYRLGDNPSINERDSLGRKLGAVYTGEKRPPRKGEWYLSGADVHAYRAPNDLTAAYCIARLVRVREVHTVEIVAEAAPC